MSIKKTLLEDIANELNVSKTLVSMVINGKGDSYGISKKTQKKVLDKAQELQYTPNVFARALRTGKSHLIGLLIPDISNPFYSHIAKFVEKTLAEKGYNVMICSTDEDCKKEESLITLFAEQNFMDGLIVASACSDSLFFEKEKLQNFPIVFVDRYFPNLKSNYVVSNNYQGSFDLTDVLIHKGCKNILTLNVTPSFISSLTERVNGFKDCLKKYNIPFTKDSITEISFNNIENEVRKVLVQALKKPRKIDAIYTLNNNLATACLSIFKELNFDAHKEGLHFACFDDINVFDFVQPPITSVAQPIEQIGTEAAHLVLELIENKDNNAKTYKKIVLPTSIISRL